MALGIFGLSPDIRERPMHGGITLLAGLKKTSVHKLWAPQKSCWIQRKLPVGGRLVTGPVADLWLQDDRIIFHWAPHLGNVKI